MSSSRTDHPRDATIHGLFEEQAARTPDSVAVVCGDARVTYSELDRRAAALARRLSALGVAHETPVGICAERSVELIAGLLAILKAGGAYVPLDPNHPQDWLAFILADTQVPVLLTQRALVSKLPPFKAHLVCLDEPATGLEQEIASPRSTARSLAYILFTSGSTGTPKGVAVPHRGVVRLVKQTGYASFSPDETFLQLAPVSFDASTFEIWGALLNGGRLAVMPPGPSSLEEIGGAIREHGVTTLWLTAGLFNVMVDERPGDLRPLRQLLTGGDTLSVPHVRRALHELKTTRLINGYGPTESTTFACCHTISPGESLDNGVPIGRPIANTTAHILDENLHPVPADVTGELFLGGDGLARGYWNRPGLTAEKFIADPFGIGPDARLYRTGDLARFRADGVIEFAGRLDHQVKIRGFRVEPGEIETVLLHHDAIRQAVVVARGHDHAKELVAYFVADALADVQPASLRDWLAQKLPDFMVPAHLVPLRALPLTGSGKIDRLALPDPSGSRAQTFTAPKTELERTILEIWRTVLGFDEIGTDDNFFEIGGNSILLVEAHSKLVRTLHRQFSVTTLFQHPSITALARHLDARSGPRNTATGAAERARKQRDALARNLFRQSNE